MKKALAGILIIGIFIVGAFGLWLMACGHGEVSTFCEAMSAFCMNNCPAIVDSFTFSAFHLEMFTSLLVAVLLAGAAALAALIFFDLFFPPRLHARFKFAAIAARAIPSRLRLMRWFVLREKRDPAGV